MDGSAPRGRVAEVLRVFLVLGLTSFGGPVAHLAYFREAFVVRRRWLTEKAYADLVALCQVLPGPASSQVGMAVGLHRAGYPGMLAAWLAFTLPSAALLVAFAYGVQALGADGDAGWVHGLKAAAVAVVAHAVLGMARTLTPDVPRVVVALLAGVAAFLVPTALGQVLGVAAGAALGLTWLRWRRRAASEGGEVPSGGGDLAVRVRPGVGIAAGVLVVVLLLGLPALVALGAGPVVDVVDRFFRSGALVLGGGHVVLPLLEAETVPSGLADRGEFLAGYGAAQAVPGPLFTFAAYLGAVLDGPVTGVLGAAVALVAVFLPGALLLLAALPWWDRLRRAPWAQDVLAGTGAAVVGLLAAAFVDPVLVEGAGSVPALVLAVVAFAVLTATRVPAWAVVLVSALVGWLVL